MAEGAATGLPAFDAGIRFALTASLTGASGVARRLAVTVAAAGAFTAAVAGERFALQAASAGAVAAMVPGWWHGRLGAAARSAGAGIAVNVMLRLDWQAFHGDSSLAAAGIFAVLAWGWVATQTRPRRRRAGFVAVIAAGAVAIAALLAGGSALSVRSELTRAVDDVQAGVDSLRSVDQDEAVTRFERAARRFERAERRLTAWWTRPGQLVPVVSHNARAVEDLVEIGERLARTAAATARASDPDTVQLRNGTVDLAAVRGLHEPLAEAVDTLEAAESAARAVESPWLLPQVRREADDLRSRVAGALPDARNALAAARVAPALLGGEGPRRYLVVFQNPAEARASGGIIGNYAELTVSDGSIEMTDFGRNGDLNSATDPESRRLVGPDDYVERYGRFDVQKFWQDVTFSPHFPHVAQVAEGLYPQSGGHRVDGVISVDPVALAALLELTGPVPVPQLDQPLTSENAADLLLHDQYVVFADEQTERVDFLEHAARATFERLTGGSLPGPSRLAEVLGPMVRQGRLKLHSIHDDEQAFFEQVGLADAMAPVRSDFLGVVVQNAGQSKIDTFLERRLRYRAVVDPRTGETTATLHVELRNNAPAEGLPTYVIGGNVAEPGVNRTYLSVYTPLGLEDATWNGEDLLMESAHELDRNVFSQFLQVPPGATRTLELHLRGEIALPIADNERHYRLTLAHQPLVEPASVAVKVSESEGSTLVDEELTLEEDTTLAAPTNLRNGS